MQVLLQKLPAPGQIEAIRLCLQQQRALGARVLQAMAQVGRCFTGTRPVHRPRKATGYGGTA